MDDRKLTQLNFQAKMQDKHFGKFLYSVLFIVGSVIGVIYEDILQVIRTGIFKTHRGVIYGPFNPLYGVGVVLLVWFLRKFPKWWQQLIYGGVAMSSLEYLASWLCETFTGQKCWDYSHQFLNINGRTTVPFILGWGLLGAAFMQFIWPYLLKFCLTIYTKPYKIFVAILMSVLIVDMLISYTAVVLCFLRESGYTSKTFIGRFFEKHYPASYLKNFFTYMK